MTGWIIAVTLEARRHSRNLFDQSESAYLNRRRRSMGLQTLRRIGGQESPPSATAAANARLVRQVIEEIWNGGDLDLADHLFAADYINHGGLIPDLVRGPEAIKISVVMSRTAFPSFRVAIVDLLAEGSIVALHWVAHGTSRRHSVNEQRSGDPQSDTLSGMTFARLNAGVIQESWLCWESQGGQARVFERDFRALARAR
jgi:predicted SnoaL-like aldol condensation-catalyzing enzyme